MTIIYLLYGIDTAATIIPCHDPSLPTCVYVCVCCLFDALRAVKKIIHFLISPHTTRRHTNTHMRQSVTPNSVTNHLIAFEYIRSHTQLVAHLRLVLPLPHVSLSLCLCVYVCERERQFPKFGYQLSSRLSTKENNKLEKFFWFRTLSL